MQLVILSEAFYNDFPRAQCPEILEKENRPYYCLAVRVSGHIFAIPIRHHIRHKFAFFTINDSGLDYTKAVVIDDPMYISSTSPWIDSMEWNILKGNENAIFYGFRKFLRQYMRALKHPENPRSTMFIKYTSLKYFDIS